jgi:hypothetical protein
MLLGKIKFSNNFTLQGRMLSVDMKTFCMIENEMNKILIDSFSKFRNHFYYNLNEKTENKANKEDINIKYITNTYTITVWYNNKKYWIFENIDKEHITIHDNSNIFKGEM